MKDIQTKNKNLEKALYNFLDAVDIVQQDILDLIDKKDITKSKISKDVDVMKKKFTVVDNNLKKY